ncbi:MAG: hypothetical protein MZV64_12590 [Ignavibacteriales bacterium]|nr:hypothetical protein [Ignavibacteriales bacterium]
MVNHVQRTSQGSLRGLLRQHGRALRLLHDGQHLRPVHAGEVRHVRGRGGLHLRDLPGRRLHLPPARRLPGRPLPRLRQDDQPGPRSSCSSATSCWPCRR